MYTYILGLHRGGAAGFRDKNFNLIEKPAPASMSASGALDTTQRKQITPEPCDLRKPRGAPPKSSAFSLRKPAVYRLDTFRVLSALPISRGKSAYSMARGTHWLNSLRMPFQHRRKTCKNSCITGGGSGQVLQPKTSRT